MEFVFSPVRHFRRVNAMQKHLRQISVTSAKAVSFMLIVQPSD